MRVGNVHGLIVPINIMFAAGEVVSRWLESVLCGTSWKGLVEALIVSAEQRATATVNSPWSASPTARCSEFDP
jgi:hypothetical protein